jgi:16S rRNA G1207 methylase RsmC
MINLITQYLGSFPLYKTTQETQRFSETLPEYDCENENDFKYVMDMWNLLVYETSDVQKVDHPLFQKARVDSKVPIDLQQIHSFYHSDLEMVVEEGKHRLAQSIQKIFNDCIGKKPVTPTDWMNAYIVFLNRMAKYLDTIINQIRA